MDLESKLAEVLGLEYEEDTDEFTPFLYIFLNATEGRFGHDCATKPRCDFYHQHRTMQ